MGKLSIQFSLTNLWHAWYRFRRGKHSSHDIDAFAYNLEANLAELHNSLVNGTYQHGPYRRVSITDNKRRDLSVSTIRDRMVHRLLYDYLVSVFDRTFINDVWSCRDDKGLLGAIERTQDFSRSFPQSWVWRADITKFFDHVNQDVLKQCLRRRINDPQAFWLLDIVIDSYTQSRFGLDTKSRERERERERESFWCRTPRNSNWKLNQSDFCQYLSERTRSVCDPYAPPASLSTLWG